MTAAIRPRTDWEAIDLGLTLVQANSRLVYTTWCFVAIPLAGLCAAVTLAFGYLWLAPLMFWWLKPLLDRAPLLVLSRRLFDQDDGLGDALRQLPASIRASAPIAAVTWSRPGLLRSFNLPVWQLERLRGADRRARMRVLQHDSKGTAAWLTMLCIFMSTSLLVSLYLLLMFVAPAEFNEALGLWFVGEADPAYAVWFDALLLVFFVIAESIVEPIYVASGFTLYLNRRTRLEAWDIELAFRRLAGRTRQRAAVGTLSAAIVLAIAMVGPLAPDTAFARTTEPATNQATEPASEPASEPAVDETADKEHADDDARQTEASLAITRVLEHDDFNDYRTDRVWVSRDDPDEDTDAADEPPWYEAMAGLGDFFARVSEWLIWCTVALLAMAAWRYRHIWARQAEPPRGVRTGTPARSPTLAAEARGLPDDIPGNVATLWAGGDHAGAMSLLYRGALARIVATSELVIPDSATEADCVRTVSSGGASPTAAYFTEVARAWQRIGYAGAPPATDQVTRLCAQWHEHFGGAS